MLDKRYPFSMLTSVDFNPDLYIPQSAGLHKNITRSQDLKHSALPQPQCLRVNIDRSLRSLELALLKHRRSPLERSNITRSKDLRHIDRRSQSPFRVSVDRSLRSLELAMLKHRRSPSSEVT